MFLGSNPEELKFCVHISDPLLVFIAFIIARIWKWPRSMTHEYNGMLFSTKTQWAIKLHVGLCCHDMIPHMEGLVSNNILFLTLLEARSPRPRKEPAGSVSGGNCFQGNPMTWIFRLYALSASGTSPFWHITSLSVHHLTPNSSTLG